MNTLTIVHDVSDITYVYLFVGVLMHTLYDNMKKVVTGQALPGYLAKMYSAVCSFS